MTALMPTKDRADINLIDWFPTGHAYIRTKGAGYLWEVMIGDTSVSYNMDKVVALWFANQINAARGETERQERLLLDRLQAKDGAGE